jgi:hypothetical protein
VNSPGHAPAPTVADALQGVRAAPSILAADYGRLGAQLA